MSDPVPRLRMFAGPNGSGKSTLKNYLPERQLGYYLNPDEVEAELRNSGGFLFSKFGIFPSSGEIQSFFENSNLAKAAAFDFDQLKIYDSRFLIPPERVNSYIASVAVEFVRVKLLHAKASFSFETVMSHPGKVQFLSEAWQSQFRTYLYFVATENPLINVSRVKSRVRMGGHDVPEEKIRERYYRSLDLLLPAIKLTNRAYIFDNSAENDSGKQTWIAEVTDGTKIEFKVDLLPQWFRKAVLEKIS